MLENKTALVFAATGAIGGEVAGTFAGHGATVYASGRDQTALDGLKSEVAGPGGRSRSTSSTPRARTRWPPTSSRAGEGLDREPVGSLSGVPIPFMVALSATCGAIEALTRSLAAELSPGGVRVNCVRGDAMPETSTIQETLAGTARVLGVEVADAPPPPGTPLGRPISVAETAATAAFLASDLSSGTTAHVVDVGGRVMPG